MFYKHIESKTVMDLAEFETEVRTLLLLNLTYVDIAVFATTNIKYTAT